MHADSSGTSEIIIAPNLGVREMGAAQTVKVAVKLPISKVERRQRGGQRRSGVEKRQSAD
jgi:hypothetical protein